MANSRLRLMQDQGVPMWAAATYDPQALAWLRATDQSIYGLNFPVQHNDPTRIYGSTENELQGSTSADSVDLSMPTRMPEPVQSLSHQPYGYSPVFRQSQA
ncbi:unnamed protein product [Dibothriocephalus latus]|uniref:Uncharacterized protein n=1 Tax=Dibothriocephalus latus TaxID=60516 RepID=A0A3P7PKQ4_DIBLA|nr:unnamed protein product [Dibothriocephalus latus]